MNSDALRDDLTAVWSELLGVEMTDDVDFFEAGGHSLLATQLTSRVRRLVNHRVPLGVLFENPKFGSYVKAVEGITAAA
jgi:hypothetical protein